MNFDLAHLTKPLTPHLNHILTRVHFQMIIPKHYNNFHHSFKLSVRSTSKRMEVYILGKLFISKGKPYCFKEVILAY